MSVKGYDSLINQVNAMLQIDRVMISAMNTVLAAQKKRIFQNGLASNGSIIGKYSTKPIYISKKKQSRNTGKTYFKGGYREYKSLTGKATGSVVVRDTDQTMMDLGVHILGGGEYGIGFNNQHNADKMRWMEEKYKKDISSTTDKEDDLVMKVIEFELARL